MPEDVIQKSDNTLDTAAEAAAFPYHEQIVYEAMVRKITEDVLPFDDSERAFWFREHWLTHARTHTGCTQEFRAQYDAYQHLAILCGFVALQRLDEEDALTLLRTKILASFEIPLYELRKKIEIRLLYFPHPEERNELRDKVRDALLVCEEVFPPSSSQTAMPQGKTMTIGDWLRRYYASRGTDKSGDFLRRQNFINTDEDVKKFSTHEREQLLAILEFFDWILLRSDEPEGFEEGFTVLKDGKSMRYRYGHLESAYDAESERIVREVIEYGDQQGLWKKEDMYKVPEEEGNEAKEAPVTEGGKEIDLGKYQELEKTYHEWALSPIATAWKVESGMMNVDFLVHLDKFYEAVNKKDINMVVSALVGLAASGSIRRAFRDSDRYKNYWRKHMQGHIPKDMEEAFVFDPAGQPFLVPFLRHVLIERLKVSEKDALMIGVMLSNFARNAGEQEYANMAYGDLMTGEFKWNA